MLSRSDPLKREQLQADLVILAGSRAPWYPPQAGPQTATVVAMGETTVKEYMVYQNLFADRYVEGDLTIGLGLLADALRPAVAGRKDEIEARRQRWAEEHERLAGRDPRGRGLRQRQ